MTGKEIEEWRESRNISRRKLGELCGVDYSTVYNWERERNAPKGVTLERLENVMAGKIASTNLTSAEESLMDRILQEGKFKTREEFLSATLLHLIKNGTLLLMIGCIMFFM